MKDVAFTNIVMGEQKQKIVFMARKVKKRTMNMSEISRDDFLNAMKLERHSWLNESNRKIAEEEGCKKGVDLMYEAINDYFEKNKADEEENLQSLLAVLEGVWNVPAEVLDRNEMLNKIMEAYRAYRNSHI